jgi:DNA-binding response OmpR family regulator
MGDELKILIVDDEVLIREVIKEYAVLESYIVDEAENGLEAVEKTKNNDYDVIIIDIMMPKMDGYQAIKEIKKIKDVPFLILSARGEEYDKLFGFEIGIDDYLTKPFSPKELMARLKVITKRNSIENDLMTFDGLVINDPSHEIFIDDKKITLTPKEYDLLLYMIKNMNIALSRETLLSSVWGYDFYGDDRTIDTHIKTLRNRLGKYRKYITTIRGMGYKFEYKK